MISPRDERRWAVITAAIPLGILGLFYLFVAVVRVTLGTLPDPGTLRQPLLAWDIFATLSVLVVYPLSALALLIMILSTVFHRRILRNRSATFLLTGCIVMVVLWIDPGGCFEWLLD